MNNQIRRAMRAMAALALAGSSAACATITRGTSEAFVVNTDPVGAAVRTSNGFACQQTPCTFKMARKSEFDVTISKPGYKTLQTRVTSHVSGAGGARMAGNVLVGGLVGVGVDAISGAMLNLVPNPLAVKLEVEPPKAPETPIPAAVPIAPASPAPILATAPAAPLAAPLPVKAEETR